MKTHIFWLVLLVLLLFQINQSESCVTQYVPRNGRVTFINYSAFTAKFSVTYDYAGRREVWYSDSMWFSKYQSFELPGNAGNVHIASQKLVFIGVWESLYWADISAETDFCVVLRGTLYNPDIQNC